MADFCAERTLGADIGVVGIYRGGADDVGE
jgi:hypothetical protein